MSRPRIEIDLRQLEKLCSYCCSLGEIADFFACSPDTIERTADRAYGESFAVYRAKRMAKSKMQLRKKQIELALKGDRAMLIWLGKQYLGQSDSPVDAQVQYPLPPKWEVTIKGMEGKTPEELAQLMVACLDPTKPAPLATDAS